MIADPLDTAYIFGKALVPAIIAVVLLFWSFSRNPVKLGGVRAAIAVVVGFATAMGAFVAAHVVLGEGGPDNLQRWENPLLIGAALIGFGFGMGLAALLRKAQPDE